MKHQFKLLPQKVMPVATRLSNPTQVFNKVTLKDKALKVMTDLSMVSSITINAGDGIDDAEYKMKIRHVNMLFVIDHNEYIIGIITLNDITGPRLEQSLEEFSLPASEICILDIMTGIDEIDVLEYNHIITAEVGDVVQTLLELNRQHALVLQEVEGIQQIRGIFSTTQINKQLDSPLDFSFTNNEDQTQLKKKIA